MNILYEELFFGLGGFLIIFLLYKFRRFEKKEANSRNEKVSSLGTVYHRWLMIMLPFISVYFILKAFGVME